MNNFSEIKNFLRTMVIGERELKNLYAYEVTFIRQRAKELGIPHFDEYAHSVMKNRRFNKLGVLVACENYENDN